MVECVNNRNTVMAYQSYNTPEKINSRIQSQVKKHIFYIMENSHLLIAIYYNDSRQVLILLRRPLLMVSFTAKSNIQSVIP